MNEGEVASSTGLRIAVADYERTFEEEHVAHSTALHSVRLHAEPDAGNGARRTAYHVGPLARVAINFERLAEPARRTADDIGFDPDCRNPFQSIIARGLELIHAYSEALEILRDYRPFQPPRTNYAYRCGEGCAATEAPRGLIYHRYAVDEAGRVTFAKIVPPTSQNQRQIEADLRDWLPRVIHADDQQTALDCERLIRCYDPCISCSTHFLKLTIER